MTMLALVQTGYGVAFVSELLARTPPDPGLSLVEVDGANLRRQVGITSMKGRAFSPAAEALCRMMRSEAMQLGPQGMPGSR